MRDTVSTTANEDQSSLSLTSAKYAGGSYSGSLGYNVRRQTAVDTAGVVGASFAVIEKNWTCPDCGNENFARRPRCYRLRDCLFPLSQRALQRNIC